MDRCPECVSELILEKRGVQDCSRCHYAAVELFAQPAPAAAKLTPGVKVVRQVGHLFQWGLVLATGAEVAVRWWKEGMGGPTLSEATPLDLIRIWR